MKDELEKLLDTLELKQLEIWPGNLESVFYAEQVREVMVKYAQIMCQKQREICAENADTTTYYEHTTVSHSSIVNAPLPVEITECPPTKFKLLTNET
jgi:hypothetical protein